MIAVGISEFTFGYAFLYEQTVNNWDELKAAPILPSLYDESKGGWDAHLPLKGTDYYYQFKLTEYLFRRNALYIRRALLHERIAKVLKNGRLSS